MTSMIHKSVDARKRRNGRYKDAINPIREMFACTAAECASKIREVISDNNRLKYELEKATSELIEVRKQIDSMAIEMEALKASNPV